MFVEFLNVWETITMVVDVAEIVLTWRPFTKFLDAWAAFDGIPCVYVQTDKQKRPIRVGKASMGLRKRYWGGTGYAMAAAMHDSGNFIFVAAVPETMCAEVEEELIWQLGETLQYNIQGKAKRLPSHVELKHEGDSPAFG